MPELPLLVTEEELQRQEAGLSWPAWLLAFLSGFLCGALADLTALGLFLRWMQR